LNGEEVLRELQADEKEIFQKAIANLRQDINAGKYTPQQVEAIAAGYDSGELIRDAANFAKAEAKKQREASQKSREAMLNQKLGKPGDFIREGIADAFSRKGKGK
jgi:hypothetical protein